MSQDAAADDSSSDGEEGEQADKPNADGEPTAPTTPGGFGQVLDAPEREDAEGESVAKQAREWQIAVDCSGSVNARQLGLFEAEIRSILAGQRPRCVHVLYFDAQVHKVECYEAGQPVTLTPVGGGGTDFRPCFRWLEERGIMPQTLVFLTDLCGRFPNDVPPYPVLWASTETRVAPFGQVIPMEAA